MRKTAMSYLFHPDTNVSSKDAIGYVFLRAPADFLSHGAMRAVRSDEIPSIISFRFSALFWTSSHVPSLSRRKR